MDKLKDLWTKFLSLKKWQKAVVYFVILMLIGSIGNLGGSSDTSSSGSVQERSYPVQYLSHADINPATVSVRFGVTNDGSQPITPTCKIKMSDSSGTYSGYDFFDITDPIAAGQTKQAVVQLTITNEGSAYVDQFTGTCTAQTSDTTSSAGKELIISDIKNLSAEDGSEGWYWGADFKVNAEPWTQMDCTIKALDKSGNVVDTHAYRGNTLNDRSVTAYGQDVLWYKDSTKSIVQSIASFDIKCTL